MRLADFERAISRLTKFAKGGSLSELLDELRDLAQRYIRELEPQDRRRLTRHELTGFANVRRPPSEVEALERIIADAPRLPEDVWVYRGGDVPVSERSRAFYPVPTSIQRNVAHVFRDPLLEAIRVPEGSPALPLLDYGGSLEAEVLLPMRGRFHRDPSLREQVPPLSRGIDAQRFPVISDILDPDRYPLDDFYHFEAPYKARGGLVDY